MTVLLLLAAARNEVVTREELIDRCWGGRVVSDDAVNRVIGELRKLARRAQDPFRIDTLYGVGFRLVADAPPQERAERSAPASQQVRRSGLAGRRGPLVAFAIVALAVVAAWTLYAQTQTTRSLPEVVVEPFAITGPGLSKTFAADLREDVLTTFQPGAADVMLRSTAPWYGGGAYRLRGRVEPAGDHVDIYARLEPPNGSQILWSAHFEAPLGRARPESVGHAVAFAVSCIMRIADGPQAPGLASPAAASWADYCVENAGNGRADIARELTALRRTAALAPRFFPARVFLSLVASSAADRASPGDRPALRAEGLASALAAQRLQPSQGEGYMAEAVARQDAEPTRAEALFRKALSLHPSRKLWEAQEYSHLLERLGRIDEAAEQHRRVLAVQPNNPFEMSGLAWDEAIRGRHDSAGQILGRLERQLIDAQCFVVVRLDNALWSRNWPEAQAIAGEPSGCLVAPGRAELVEALRSGDPARIAQAGQDFERLSADPATLSRFTVTALGLTGRDRAAVDALGRLADREGLHALRLAYEPSFAAARRTPEFDALAARYGLIAAWRASGHPPDFCRTPDPPALCRRLAEKRVGGPPSSGLGRD